MRKVSHLEHVGLVGGFLVLTGCTAILGSFDVEPSSDQPDTGTDVTPPIGNDGASPNDAAPDGPAAAPLSCSVNGIRVLETTTDPLIAHDRFLHVFRGGGSVRVVSRLRPIGATTPAHGLRTYGFDPKKPAGPIEIGKFEGERGVALDVRRQGQLNQISVLAVEGQDTGTAAMYVYNLPDDNLTSLTKTVVSRDFSIAPNAQKLSGSLGVYGTSTEYFWSFSASASADPRTLDLFAGHQTETNTGVAALVANGPDGPGLTVRESVRTNAGVFIFNKKGPELVRPDETTSYFQVAETAVVLMPPLAPHAIAPAGSKGTELLAVGATASGGLRVAVAEFDFKSTDAPVVVRAGDIAAPDPSSSIDGTKLPIAFSLTSLVDVPFDAAQPRLVNDDLVWVGSPTEAQKGRGLNFVWYNFSDNKVRAHEISTNRLLPTHNGIIASNIGFAGLASANGGDFDLAWVEASIGQTSLFYGELHCVK